MDALSTELLIDLVDRKLHLLTEIRWMTIEQMQWIERDEVDSLIAILNRKREAMEGLQQVQTALKPYQSQDADERVWRSDTNRLDCRAKVEQCDRLLAELITMENVAVQALSKERELISQQINSMQSAATIDRVYQHNSSEELEDASVSHLSLEG